MLEVTSAEYVEGYKIRVSFNTGQAGIVDLKGALWGPVFEPVKDPSVFKRFKVSETLHTICWENGADFAPEFLLEKMVEQSQTADSATPRR
jgi:hypothetical protein